MAWPLVIFLLLVALMRAETAAQAGVQRYNGPGNTLDYACAVAMGGSRTRFPPHPISGSDVSASARLGVRNLTDPFVRIGWNGAFRSGW
jgi:hypothetical protein